jgi:ADP-ribose pyrophosphatase
MEIYKGRRLSVEKEMVRFPNGVTKEKIIVQPGHAVAILPVEGARCKLLWQYRYPIRDYIYEAPAGTMEEGEDPAETARRELIEETGFAAEKIEPLGFIYTTPGFTDEKIYLFKATGLFASNEFGMDEDAVIEVIEIPVLEIGSMIATGRLVNAKTICLFHRCFG